MTQTYPFKESFRDPSFEPKVDSSLKEELQGASSTLIEKLRQRARKDRYFLGKGVLGYKDMNPYTHGPLCRALEDQSRQRRMYLAPRGHLKTTVATITDCVGDALDDPEETRILIVNEIEDNAIGFLSEIKAHFEGNEILPILFPELIPQRFGGPGSKWSGAKACLPRSTAYKEWTWTAAGVGKALASTHFTKIKCDDLIGFEAKESAANMRYAISFAKAMEPLLIDMDTCFIDFVGTRWGLHDLYREMLNTYSEDMAYFAREDIEQVPELPLKTLREVGFGWVAKGKPELSDEGVLAKVGTLQPIFPRKFSLKKLHRMSLIDPVLYYAQYKNNPISDGVKDFNATKLRWFDIDGYGNIVYRDTEGRLQRWTREQLDVVMACDPNSGELTSPDFPAIIVAAISPLEQVFVLDTWSRRVQPDAFVDRMYEMWQYWQPRVMGIEKAAMSQSLFYFKKKAKQLGVYINVQPLTPKNKVKESRIRKSLQPIVNDDRMFVRKMQTILQHQVKFYPDIENDDEIDALAYTTELFRAPLTSRDRKEEEDAVVSQLNNRNKTTGYGR